MGIMIKWAKITSEIKLVGSISVSNVFPKVNYMHESMERQEPNEHQNNDKTEKQIFMRKQT